MPGVSKRKPPDGIDSVGGLWMAARTGAAAVVCPSQASPATVAMASASDAGLKSRTYDT